MPKQSSQTGDCTACTPPEWSDWERDDSGCLLVRKCIVLDDQDESCNKECIGKSKKEVPCITGNGFKTNENKEDFLNLMKKQRFVTKLCS